jgi:hypothetical protein
VLKFLSDGKTEKRKSYGYGTQHVPRGLTDEASYEKLEA